MADTCGVTRYQEYEPDGPRGWSPLAVALIATLVLMLGLGGALSGIYAAAKVRAEPSASVTPPATSASATAPHSSPPPATSSPGTSPGTTAPTGAFALPDLTGLDFQLARTKVRELKLGWRLFFEGADPADGAVRTTDPQPGVLVTKGTTVKIFVKGAAPLASVPDVTGLSCSQGAASLIDHGLYPNYLTGRDGTVLSQSPTATDLSTLRWNDEVHISCG